MKNTCDETSERLLYAALTVSLCGDTYLEPPEGITGVGASVEEAAGLGPGAQQVLGRKALSLRDVANLTERNDTRVNLLPFTDIT